SHSTVNSHAKTLGKSSSASSAPPTGSMWGARSDTHQPGAGSPWYLTWRGDAMGALDGIKVLDLAILIQGPQAASMLADLGAEVLNIELPELGDLARCVTVSPSDERSAWFWACNRGKRSVTLDLRTAGGTRAFRALIATADVMVSNF